GPHHLVVHRIAIGEHLLGDALADDHYLLAVFTIGIVEIAAGYDRHAQRGEKSRRHGAEHRAGIFIPYSAGVAVGAELKSRAENILVAPGNRGADRHAIHAWQRRDLTHR